EVASAVARRGVESAASEGRLEAGERCAAAVAAKDELVEVDLQVLSRDAVVSALQPGLQVRERPVRAWQHPLAVGEAGALLVRLVCEASGAQAAVTLPAVGVDERAR